MKFLLLLLLPGKVKLSRTPFGHFGKSRRNMQISINFMVGTETETFANSIRFNCS